MKLASGLDKFAHMAPVHADIGDRAIPHDAGQISQGRLEEGHELWAVHLAARKRKLAVLARTQPADIAIDSDIVRRVSEHEVGVLSRHQPVDFDVLLRIAAQQPVIAKDPEIAASRHCIARDSRHDVLRRIASIGIRLARLVENEIDLGKAEAGQIGVELEVDQSLQLDREKLPIPARIERKLVVRQHVGTSPGLGEMRQRQGRHRFEPE